jgi:hypothetical protein
MNEQPKLILLTDIIEQKVRKEKELQFCEKELEKLQSKMYWLRREIGLNETIIDIIKNDAVLDIKDNMGKRMIEE